MDKKHTVLVIYNDTRFRKTLSDILEIKGYIPIVFGQGQVALDKIKTDLPVTEPPVVALIGLKLADTSGLTIMKALKEYSPATKYILLTGYATQDSVIEAINLRAYGYMQKPYDIEQLLVMIRRAVEKRETEEALRQSEERFRQVITSISDHIYVSEITPDGDYINRYLSPHIESLTGYPQQKFADDWRFWASVVIHPDDRALAAAQTTRLAKGHPSEVDYRIIRADKKVIWVRDSARAENEKRSRVIYGLVSDITERKLLEEQLRQSQKMDAIGRLAGGVAHDFNNILTVIRGYSELLLHRSLDKDDPRRKEVEQIKKAGERAASLTRQLLAFSRQQLLQPRVLDLNTVVNDMDMMLRRLIGEDIELITIPEQKLGYVEADPGQIEQVVMNLAINARDAMPQGGKLIIKTTNVELDSDKARHYVDVTPGSYIVLSVSDTGSGMDKELQERIFEPFFTTKAKDEGTGLGLSTVYGIVNQSGGHIWVYSKPDYGTMFRIYLPRVNEELPSLSEEEMIEMPQGSETILVVEDDDMVRDLALNVLQRDGYKVLRASYGAEALQLCQTHTGVIDLLLTDVVMPGGISGGQLAKQLTSSRPEMKVLYMSGYTDDTIVRHGIVNQGLDFIQKPFTLIALSQKVREVLERVSSP